ncbi:glycosyltransferase family 87 protein [Pseudaminobacter sp. NGMCC 1.201702]|uniref:glycosyltransferase family 87 protein n=1 Tax=Pseudaminobacter sp. NGMCC 1.201702 TaxID=3391825 RepID=UPI0039F033AB
MRFLDVTSVVSRSNAASHEGNSGVLRLAVTLALALAASWAIATELPRLVSAHALWDFGAFIASGRAAAQGLDPYGIYPPLTPHVVVPGFETWNPNLNPPISALLFQLFDIAEPRTSLWVWLGISIACYTAAVVLLVQRYTRGMEAILVGIWAFGLAGFLDALYLGQIYLPFVLAAVGAWLLLERGENFWSGILIGLLVAMKPNFLVWPTLLFLSGHRVSPLISFVTAAAISAVPLAVFGPDIYWRWLTIVASDGERAYFLTNASFAGLAARIGMPAAGVVLSGLLLAGLAAWAYWRRPTVIRASSFGLLAAVLASPLGWIHYTLFLLPVLLRYWRRSPTWLVAALLIIPAPYIISQFGEPVWVEFTVGSAYGWALVLFLVVLIADEWRGAASTPDDFAR